MFLNLSARLVSALFLSLVISSPGVASSDTLNDVRRNLTDGQTLMSPGGSSRRTGHAEPEVPRDMAHRVHENGMYVVQRRPTTTCSPTTWWPGPTSLLAARASGCATSTRRPRSSAVNKNNISMTFTASCWAPATLGCVHWIPMHGERRLG
jgi:hypothetical protein